MEYHISPAGRDCMGNYSGYTVARYVRNPHETPAMLLETIAEFYGDIYEPGSIARAQRQAEELRDRLNAEATQ